MTFCGKQTISNLYSCPPVRSVTLSFSLPEHFHRLTAL